jgi:hypothetical protein
MANELCAASTFLLLVHGTITAEVAKRIDTTHQLVYACADSATCIFAAPQTAKLLPASTRYATLLAEHFVDPVFRRVAITTPGPIKDDILWLADAVDIMLLSRPKVCQIVKDIVSKGEIANRNSPLALQRPTIGGSRPRLYDFAL